MVVLCSYCCSKFSSPTNHKIWVPVWPAGYPNSCRPDPINSLYHANCIVKGNLIPSSYSITDQNLCPSTILLVTIGPKRYTFVSIYNTYNTYIRVYILFQSLSCRHLNDTLQWLSVQSANSKIRYIYKHETK